MKWKARCLIAAVLFVTAQVWNIHQARAASNSVYELRMYHTFPNRLTPLVNRFRAGEVKVFEKNHMTFIGGWIPQDEPQHENLFVYMLAHENREAATKNWAAFGADPEWKAIQQQSEADGKIVERVESTFMEPLDYSPLRSGLPATRLSGTHVFELRTDRTYPGKLQALIDRIGTGARPIFARHGVSDVGYWSPQDAPQKDTVMIYMLAHDNRDAAKKNNAAFGADPEWKDLQQKTEVDGKLIEKFETLFLDPVDFSPLK